ncbi:MAG: hypothetical protein IJD99_09340 [Clostridia bacterium]|nr:hypothetical protein [Clostridia bacterium]
MNDMKNFLRDVGYFGIGAAAVLVEAGGKVVKSLVRKGEKVLTDNQDTVDDLKEKAKQAGERIKAAVQELSKKEEIPEADIPEAEMPEVEAPEIEVPESEIPEVEVPEVESVSAPEAPVVPDVIYRTDEPVPAEEAPADPDESPEETING